LTGVCPLADLRNDGKLDLVVANFSLSAVGVLLNKGDGTFGTPVPMKDEIGIDDGLLDPSRATSTTTKLPTLLSPSRMTPKSSSCSTRSGRHPSPREQCGPPVCKPEFTKNYMGRLSSVRNFRVESCLIPDS
jgi:hypothetical protein